MIMEFVQVMPKNFRILCNGFRIISINQHQEFVLLIAKMHFVQLAKKMYEMLIHLLCNT